MVFLVSLALVFYAVLPLFGAHRVRSSWGKFREACSRAQGSPEVDFSALQSDAPLPFRPLRLTGTLEAFEGADRLWIGNNQVSVAVSLRGAPVYFIDEQPEPFEAGAEPPRKAEAASLGALPEGTQFLVWGSLVSDRQGQVHFESVPTQRLLVLAFEGDPTTVLARAVYAGRAILDHWNSWTPVAFVCGFLSFLSFATAEFRPDGGDHFLGMCSLALALLPSTFFLPPGILFFYLFSRLWAQGRNYRATADLAEIGTPGAPGGGPHRVQARRLEIASFFALGAGAALNLFLLVGGLKLWFWFP